MSTIKQQFIFGILYTGAAKYIGIFIQLIISGILARLLSPADFGIVAIATVFIIFFNLLGDLGFGPAIIQNKELNKKDFNNIFSYSVYLGLLLSAIFFFSSSYIAYVYNNAILYNVCRLLALNIFFSVLNIVPNSLLLREKKFRFIAVRSVAIQIFCGGISIYAAFINFGVYSLVIYSISFSFLIFIINYLQNPLTFILKVRVSTLKNIANFSFYQFLFNFINYFSRNLDKFLLGKFISISALGFYDKSYRLMLLPVENLTHVITPVLHPIFSDFQKEKGDIYSKYIKVVQVLAMIGFTLSVILHFTASELIILIFGYQWENSIPVFKILAWTICIQMILSSSGSIFQAANSTKYLFISGLFSAVFMILGTSYGVFIAKNLEGLGIGLLIAFIINFFQAFFILIKVVLGQPLLSFIKVLYKPIIIGAIVYLIQLINSVLFPIDLVVLSFFIKLFSALIAFIIGLGVTGEYKLLLSIIKKNKVS